MQKPGYFFFIFSLSLCAAAAADTIGLRVGLYADSPDILSDDRQFFLTPQLEYKQRLGIFDVYAAGEYTFNITGPYPQFFFAEEGLAARLHMGSLSEFRIGLRNENDFRFNPKGDGGAGAGRVTPEAAYALFLPAGDISLSLGAPLTYPLWGGEGNTGGAARFGLEAAAAYVSPFWLGFEAAVRFTAAPAAAVDGMEFIVNYTQDQFYGKLALNASESFGYFSLKAEFDYFFDFFILKAGLEVGNFGGPRPLTLAPAIGIKYRF